jgi:6-pyruvoyltetrahydropterin/6-carboxytetrahydropterin synthase
MKATIAKRFTFDAAHRLDRLPESHKCHRMHGHTYEVEIVLHGPVDGDGFVADYEHIAMAWQPIFDAIDHRVLNDIPGLEVPSTENLCAWMFNQIASDRRPELVTVKLVLAKIRIWESSTTWCEISAHEWLASASAHR